MATIGLSHINFHAERSMLDALKHFYCDIVGLHQGPRPPFPDFGYWLYAGDDPIVHLYVAADGEERRMDVTTTFDHIAFNCVNQAEMEAALRRSGIQFRREIVPRTNQVQFFVRDPAGNNVELNFSESSA